MQKTVLTLAVAALLAVGLAASESAPKARSTGAIRVEETAQTIVKPADAISIPRSFSYQGRLLDSTGVPVSDTTYQIRFGLYTDRVGGFPFWLETQEVRTENGLFSLMLGSEEPISQMPEAGEVYLGMKVEADPEMTPRLQLGSAAYSFLAENAEMLQGLTIDSLDRRYMSVIGDSIPGDLAIRDGIRVHGKALLGRESDNPGLHAHVAGFRDSAVGQYSVVSGGRSNTAAFDYATVGGGHLNRASGVCATVGGGSENYADYDATTVAGGVLNEASDDRATVGGGGENSAEGYASTVAGGHDNLAESDYATVGGGLENAAEGYRSVIAGGYGNEALETGAAVGGGFGNVAEAERAVVSGGEENIASGYRSFVGGGYDNAASARHAVVAGGLQNQASFDLATVGGGHNNIASGQYSVVAGGRLNSAEYTDATVGGGYGNSAGDNAATVSGGGENEAESYATTIGGGLRNAADADYATVGGGYLNVAEGYRSTVSGGFANHAVYAGAVVAGGYENSANEDYTAVGGGLQNYAEGYCATIPGGYADSCAGDGGMAAGYRVRTTPDAVNTFAFGKSFRTETPNAVVFYHHGETTKLGIGVMDPAQPIDVAGGAYCTGTNWVNASSRRLKKDISELTEPELREVLRELNRTNVVNYRYRSDASSEEHIGLIAEEAPAAIATPERDGINTSDAIGFLLAALKAQQIEIQGLRDKLTALEQE